MEIFLNVLRGGTQPLLVCTKKELKIGQLEKIWGATTPDKTNLKNIQKTKSIEIKFNWIKSNLFKILGRTDLRIGVSWAKFDAEADFEVRLPLAPPKPCWNCEKGVFQADFANILKIFRKCLNASERIWTHPNASECIRTRRNRSEQVRKLRKTCENFKNFAKNLRKIKKS